MFETARRIAKKSPNRYKHVWIVYDTDDFPPEHINLVPDLCESENQKSEDTIYHANWSNQCFELWYLLHFNLLRSDLHRKEYFPKLSAYLKQQGAGSYEKNRKDIYSILEPYLDKAISNADELEEANSGKAPSEAAPGTMVHHILKKLRPYLSAEHT